jgi:molybdopterin/thiamine biosynthesis adenylyltransferase/rhodanese-related sulfurtransferase
MTLSSSELSRYSRHLALPEIGLTGQETLKNARVLVIGAGGLGAPALLYLASGGVGTIGIVDFDRVDLSNLQRQVLYTVDDVGQPKVRVAARRLKALNPHVQVREHEVVLRAENVRDIFEQYDCVIDGTDQFATRYLVNDACVLLRKPLVSAAIHRFEGQAMTYVPGKGCYRCLFPVAPSAGAVPNCAEAGVLGVLPGVLGAVQATEAMKWILGVGELLTNRLLTYDALTMRVNEFSFTPREDCAVCGANPSIRELQDLVPVCSLDQLNSIQRIEPRDLMQWRDGSELVIDVRRATEFEVSHLLGAKNIPLDELPERANELLGQPKVLFVCRGGTRSFAACQIAIARGIKNPAHLEGGLLTWSQEMQPTFVVAPA